MAKRQPPRASDQPELLFATTKKAGRSPEEIARAAVARRARSPSGNILFTISLALPRVVAEWLTARAVREEKNIDGVVTDILEAEARRRGS